MVATMKSEQSEIFIKASGVGFDYGKEPVLIDINFSVGAGTLVGLVGPNGSGKTTLLKLILGLLPLMQGEIVVFGQSVGKLREARNKLGYVPQDPRVQKGIPVTVAEMVEMSRYAMIGPLRRLSQKDENVVRWAIEAVGLTGFANEYVFQLSDGLQQRACIARALAKEPKLLCLDEPASSLDLGARKTLYALLRNLRDQHGITHFVVSHDLQLLAEHADKLILIDHHVIAEGVPADVVNRFLFDRSEAEFTGCRDHEHHS